jgi:hypothetical protein
MLCVLLAAAAATPAAAAVFTVTSTANSGAGSLRQAVLDANTAVGGDTITFAIAGAGPHTIALQAAGLDANGPLTIDGYTQSGASPNSLTPSQGGLDGVLRIVLLPAASGGAASAFVLNAGEVTLRGLVLSGFGQSAAVQVSGAATVVRIEGCYFGTSADGNAVTDPAQGRGIFVSGGRLHLGGPQPAQRNLLSGHLGDALQLSTNAAAGSTIEGNLFGTTASGAVGLGNGGVGGGHAVQVVAAGAFNARDLRIGGTDANTRNVFASGANPAIRLNCAALNQSQCLDGLLVQGNYIGTDTSGNLPLPNNTLCPAAGCTAARSGGVLVEGSSIGTLTIGGTAPGAGNRIAFNAGAAIGWSVSSAAAVLGALEIVGNSMNDNGAGGVELVRLNVPASNDAGDVDEGPNRLQNAPVLQAVEVTGGGGQLAIDYRIDTAAGSASYPLRVDFYRSSDGDEGSEYLGSDLYTGAFAQVTRSVVLGLAPGVSGLPLVALATDADRHSGKFSNVLGVVVFGAGFESP